jgi:thiamine biosynthesis protein ThiI
LATYVVHYAEVALKGNNRPRFVSILRRNILRSLARLGGGTVTSLQGRLVVESDRDGVQECLGKVFGVSWYARAVVVRPAYGEILCEALRQATEWGRVQTFRVSVRRTDKSFPLTSSELAERLGREMVESTGMSVSLKNPDRTLYVDILKDSAFLYSEKLRGPGGLPVGSSGRVMHLFSGGIDSPVAAWLLMKRGCRPVYVHFYLANSVDDVLGSKVVRLVTSLAEYSGRSTLILLPFADYQVATSGAPPGSEPSLFRYFMRLAAEELAQRFRAVAISTGDSLSQAASQTLWNIAALDSGCPLPILRPLLTYDKQEIVDLAKRIGTYEQSVEEYKDCCSIITRHPRTRVSRTLILDLAERFDFMRLLSSTIDSGTLFSHDHSTGRSKVAPLTSVLDRTGREALASEAST